MRYYVAADIHGFFTPFHNALEEAGYFEDGGEKRLVICGDLFDRGTEAKKLQDIVLEMLKSDQIILIRGNHEDLFCDLVTKDRGLPYNHHVHNGTYQTALDLTGYDIGTAGVRHFDFAEAGRRTPYYTEIIPAMLNYYETAHYVFVHGWMLLAQYLEQASFFGTEETARSARIEGIVKDLDAGIQSMRDAEPLPADEVFDELCRKHGFPIPEKDSRQDELNSRIIAAVHEYGMYGRTRERKRLLTAD